MAIYRKISTSRQDDYKSPYVKAVKGQRTREGVGGVTTLNGRYNSLPKLSDFCFLKGAFEAVVLCLRHISQSLEQGVSVSRTS